MPVEFLNLEKMRQLREKKGLTQEQAGDAAQLGGRQGWWQIESGHRTNVTLEVLARMAKVLGVEAKDLLK